MISGERVEDDEYEIKSVDLKKLGAGYTSASVTFSAPQLPGGVTATATANGLHFVCSIEHTDIVPIFEITEKSFH